MVSPSATTAVYGQSSLSYGGDFRTFVINSAGVIGWATNTVYYGMSGTFQTPTYYSFFGNTGAFISGGVWATSDGRLKTVTSDLDTTAALAAVNALLVKQYTPTTPAARGVLLGREDTAPTETLYGWVAQDVEQVIPIAVRDVGVPPDDLVTRAALKRSAVPQRDGAEASALSEEAVTVKAINDRYMLTTLWSAVQQLSKQNDDLRARIDTLEGVA